MTNVTTGGTALKERVHLKEQSTDYKLKDIKFNNIAQVVQTGATLNL